METRKLGRRELLRAAAGAPFLSLAGNLGAAAKSYFVYWGTYTEGGGQFGTGDAKGIYLSRMDASTGKLTEPELAAETPNPSWMVFHPSRKYLYVVNERVQEGGKIPEGEVSAYAVDAKTGKLKFLNKVGSKGGQPCHIATDRTGKMAMVANWYTGSAAGFPILKNGELGESTAFSQHEAPRSGAPEPAGRRGAAAGPQIHCHCVVVTPDNRFLLATDTGLNKIYVYRLDAAKAGFTPHDPPFLGLQKPTNPRHLALHPNTKWGYVANETAPGGCTMVKFDAKAGTLEEGPVVKSVPDDYKGRGSQAECMIHPSGKFVYVSNRGHNSIAVFQINQTDGTLAMVQCFVPGGNTPRSFGIDPSGNFLLAMMQASGKIFPLRIDQETGKLTPAGDPLNLSRPVCAVFL